MKLILLSLSLTFMSSATHANGFFIFSTVEKKTIPCSFKFSSNFTSKQEEQIETFFFEKGYNMNDKEEAEGVPEFLVEAASKNYSLGSEMDYHEYLITNLTSYDVVNKNILQIFDTVKGILVETLHDRSLVNIC